MSDVLGVDIGMNMIKVVSLSKDSKGSVCLDIVGETKTPKVEWLKEDNNSKSLDEVADSLKSLLSDLKSKAKQACVCLPEDEVISRIVRLPPLKDSEIKDVLKFEAETFVPYPLDQVSIDYEIVDKDDSGRLTIFVIAAKNKMIQSYIKLFKSVGLELVALESPSISIRRIVNTFSGNIDGVMVIDMGERYSDIVALHKGNISFTRSMSVGGESMTRAISINLGLDMASAEEYKKAYGLVESELEAKIRNAITPVFNSIIDEVRKAMALYLEEHGKPFDLLVLSGGGANLPGLAEELTKLLGIEVQVIQPFLHIDTTKINPGVDLKTEGSRFSLAVGLALRGLA